VTKYRLEHLGDENAGQWEEFNASSPEGSPFHSLRWKRVLENGLGASCDYLVLLKDENVFGLFPFVRQTIRGFKGYVPPDTPISLHAILEDYRDPLAISCVLRKLQRVRNPLRLSFVSLSALRPELFDTITTHPLYPYAHDGDMILDLGECPPETIWNAFSASRRKTIRRFENNGFEITEEHSLDALELFYRHHAANLKYIGGTLHPFSYFVELWNAMSDEIRLTILSKGPVVAGGLLQLTEERRKRLYTLYLSLNRDLPQRF
jgi:hypothetical protein